ncbi:MAG: hypothetical protein KDH96_10035, partial [Candidatus Riesia sp.]|nr:hypothetical protein [Candidatus Riesia sp.]
FSTCRKQYYETTRHFESMLAYKYHLNFHFMRCIELTQLLMSLRPHSINHNVIFNDARELQRILKHDNWHSIQLGKLCNIDRIEVSSCNQPANLRKIKLLNGMCKFEKYSNDCWNNQILINSIFYQFVARANFVLGV